MGPFYLHGALLLLCGPITPILGLSLYHKGALFFRERLPGREVGGFGGCSAPALNTTLKQPFD